MQASLAPGAVLFVPLVPIARRNAAVDLAQITAQQRDNAEGLVLCYARLAREGQGRGD